MPDTPPTITRKSALKFGTFCLLLPCLTVKRVRPKASWEHRLGELSMDILYGNGGETTPQYWNTNFTLDTLGQSMNLLRRTAKEHELIRVTFRAFIRNINPAVQFIGFTCAYLGYAPTPHGPVDLGAGSIPGINSGVAVLPLVDSADYDPVSLPVGGVTFPIWQRKSIDPLTADHYIERADNPNFLVGCTIVQVQASTALSPAATVDMWFRYERFEE